MIRTLNKRRWLMAVALFGLLTLTVGVLARVALTGMAVGSVLKLVGASAVKFNVAQASPWRVVLEDLDFQVKTQVFAAKRVSMTRPHWWTPSLGLVRVEAARVPVTIDGSDTNPTDWPTYQNGSAAADPVGVPMDEVVVDGQLIVRAAEQPDQTLTVKLQAKLTAKDTWTGNIQVDGPGVGLKGEGGYDVAGGELKFKLPSVALDLKTWQGFIHRLIVLPGGTWELEGKVNGQVEGSLQGRNLKAGGKVNVREGRVRYAPQDVTAEGVEGDFEFVDFDKVETKPGTVRIKELRTGKLSMRDVAAELAFNGPNKIVVSQISLQTLGGKVSAEPFKYFVEQRTLEAVLLVDGVDIEQVMALTKDLPAKASGRVDGRFPVRIDGSGVRLGTGWLALKPGVYAELQLSAGGLLTSGVSPGNPSYGVLKKVESGLLKLQITELRLDIRPPNAPPGRSAQLRISGSPVDPTVKAPVTLDLNVNGPLEKLLNLGLNSRLSFGN
jgi:Dicarboxylate transport